MDVALGDRPHRLSRDRRTAVIAGVASGIACYYGIAARWVRLAFLVPILGAVLAGISSNEPSFVFVGDDSFAPAPVLPIAALLATAAYLLLWLVIPASDASAAGGLGDRQRRLFRDPDDMIVAGVLAGLAHYCGVKPRNVRFAALGTIAAGAVIGSLFDAGYGLGSFVMVVSGLIYIFLWIFVPFAKTPIDKLSMRGDPVTLVSVAQQARSDEAPPARLRTGAGAVAVMVGLIIRMTVVGAAWAGGAFIAVGSVVAVVGLTVLLTMVIANPAVWHVTQALASSTRLGMKYYPFVLCSYVLMVIPLVLIGTLAIGALQKQRGFHWKRFTPGVYATATAVWMTALIVCAWLWASSVVPSLIATQAACCERYEPIGRRQKAATTSPARAAAAELEA